MNEAETRAEHIDPALKTAGWGVGILLTLATGTGKTFIAFQIAWKLYSSRWNLTRERLRRPRILFLADRNIFANQAYNAFSAFPEDALVRIAPEDIRNRGRVPMNGSLFFTIFQTFMSGPPKDGKPSPYFGEYPPDFFDFIVIDECHRGGANDESNWRGILDYFAPAVQLGLTAKPKRKDNVDTYAYFGEPVYIYSLKDGINDGFLTPFKVKQIPPLIEARAGSELRPRRLRITWHKHGQPGKLPLVCLREASPRAVESVPSNATLTDSGFSHSMHPRAQFWLRLLDRARASNTRSGWPQMGESPANKSRPSN